MFVGPANRLERDHPLRWRRGPPVGSPAWDDPDVCADRMALAAGRPEATVAQPEPAGLHDPVLAWYRRNARRLPWRRGRTSPWGVLVSEVMLQQTPVSRVLRPYAAWMERWPAPRDLAADTPGEAIRMWGRLGYPRRSLRLHSAATACVDRYRGKVPADVVDLRSLPGVGDYTAAAVASFAFRQRHAVLDTNVRRVLARVLGGEEFAPQGSPSIAERRLAEDALPQEPERAASWAAAVMELGALVCTSRAPRCESCPIAGVCRWNLAGRPPWTGAARRGQAYEGTDRQARGSLLAVLRDAPGPVAATGLATAWPDPPQRARALDGLVADGLVEPLAGTHYRLPRTGQVRRSR
jgi:A/G-specific adenine glycosylase